MQVQQQQTLLWTCLVIELYGFIHMGLPTYCPFKDQKAATILKAL